MWPLYGGMRGLAGVPERSGHAVRQRGWPAVVGHVLAVASAMRLTVFLGDPQQLAQPSQAAPPRPDVSALEHILGDRATIAPNAGLLIDKT